MPWPLHALNILQLSILLPMSECSDENPKLHAEKALHLDSSKNEHLASFQQAMSVWFDPSKDTNPEQKEYLVAQTHVFNTPARRMDDEQWVVVWEMNEFSKQLKEVHRKKLSCPNVALAIPNRAPYAYEARISMASREYVLHPECSCLPGPKSSCPRGVHVSVHASNEDWILQSPGRTHYIHIEDEYGRLNPDQANPWTISTDIIAQVHVVKEPLLADIASGDSLISGDAEQGCPGSKDEILGSRGVTLKMLKEASRINTPSLVQGKWCLVNRGHCDITAKVKACLFAGAVGVVVVDHASSTSDFEDQDATIRITHAAGERPEMIIPVIFVSRSEGKRIKEAAIANEVILSIGPSFAAPPVGGYTPGTGLTVHNLEAAGFVGKTEYPDLFGHVGWMQVSNLRDILFVCLPEMDAIDLYNVSQPSKAVEFISRIQIACSVSGTRDNRVFEYKHNTDYHWFAYHTVIVDPMDKGNKIYYYDTTNPRNPVLSYELHASWEHKEAGLGQVKTGGPSNRYHLVTAHCSDLYCGKNHGDAMYLIDSSYIKYHGPDSIGKAKKIQLPISKGSFVRDVACDNQAICLATLTWDGAVALDLGVSGTVNKFEVVASQVEGTPFSSREIPYHEASLRMHSGAQKVYASQKHQRSFYVEHADFSMGTLKLGNVIEAIELNQIWHVTLENYDAQVEVKQEALTPQAFTPQAQGMTTTMTTSTNPTSSSLELDDALQQSGETGFDAGNAGDESNGLSMTVTLVIVCVCLLFSLVAAGLLLHSRAVIRKQRTRLLEMQREKEAMMVRPATTAVAGNLVLGRPCSEDEMPETGAHHGEPVLPFGSDAKGALTQK